MYIVQTIENRRVFEESFATFEEAIEHVDNTANVWNAEQCDYATDTGFYDGLTDEERAQLEAL